MMSWPSWSHRASLCHSSCGHRNLPFPAWASTAGVTLLPPVPSQPLPSCADCRGWEPSSPDVDVLCGNCRSAKGCRQPKEKGLQQLLFHSWREILNKTLQVPLTFTVFHLRKDCIDHYRFFFSLNFYCLSCVSELTVPLSSTPFR